MRRLLAVLLAATAALSAAPAQAEDPPERGPMLVVGHVAGVVFVRQQTDKVLVTDLLLVQDGNILFAGEDPAAFQHRRTWTGAVRVTCDLVARSCALGRWFLKEVPAGSFVYDAVRGEARLHAVISKKETVTGYFAVSDPVPNRMTPLAGCTVNSDDIVVTGGEAVTRRIAASATVFGRSSDHGIGTIITGVVHNIYVTPPVDVC